MFVCLFVCFSSKIIMDKYGKNTVKVNKQNFWNLKIPVWAFFADMPTPFVWQLIQPLMAQWYSFFLSCSASANEHHRTCALTEHLLHSCSYQQSFPRLCYLFHAMQTLLQNVCFPHGFFCGLSLDVIQELKGQHYLYVADKEMRQLKTHSEFRKIQ